MNVRGLGTRVARLERARTRPDEMAEIEAAMLDGMAAGRIDRQDGPVVLAVLKRWARGLA